MARLAAGALGGSVKDWEGYYDPEKNPRLNAEQVYVLEEDGEIRASAAVLPHKVFVDGRPVDRKSTRLNSSHANISYAVFCLKKKDTHPVRRFYRLSTR